jgi:hypothetical protein
MLVSDFLGNYSAIDFPLKIRKLDWHFLTVVRNLELIGCRHFRKIGVETRLQFHVHCSRTGDCRSLFFRRSVSVYCILMGRLVVLLVWQFHSLEILVAQKLLS